MFRFPRLLAVLFVTFFATSSMGQQKAVVVDSDELDRPGAILVEKDGNQITMQIFNVSGLFSMAGSGTELHSTSSSGNSLFSMSGAGTEISQFFSGTASGNQFWNSVSGLFAQIDLDYAGDMTEPIVLNGLMDTPVGGWGVMSTAAGVVQVAQYVLHLLND